MASTFSPSLRLELIGDGDQSGIWGQTTNNNLGGLIEQAIGGVVTITLIDANYTLANFNGVVDEARNQVLVLTGALSTQRNLIAPLVEKTYTIRNTTTGGFGVQIIGPSGTGVVIPNGVTASVFCDGINFFPATTGSLGNQTINGNLAVTGTTSLTGALSASTAVFSGAISAVSPTFSGVPTAPTAPAGTNNTQIATTAFALAAFPSGGIIMWSGSIASIPGGWLLCNGTSGTPDLRDRFIVGAGSTYAVNATGGFATYSLSTAQLPSHTHTGTTANVDINHTHSGTTNLQSNDHVHGFNVNTSAAGTHQHYNVFNVSTSNEGSLSASNTIARRGNYGGDYSYDFSSSTSEANIGLTSNAGNHIHNVAGNTGGISANHNHAFSTGAMSANNVHSHTFTTNATGSGAAIDNRPPYFALAYIMKA
jgi:microcystin-dependent protein